MLVSFTPDFTSSWVIRDLTLATSRGTSFPFTLNVTLPHHMLPLCAQVVPGPSWEETFWVVTLIFTWSVVIIDLKIYTFKTIQRADLSTDLCSLLCVLMFFEMNPSIRSCRIMTLLNWLFKYCDSFQHDQSGGLAVYVFLQCVRTLDVFMDSLS